METIHQRDCDECGNLFESKRSDARFCSARCRVAHNRREPVTDEALVYLPAPAVTAPPAFVCKCVDCLDRAANPEDYWDRVIGLAVAKERERLPIITDTGEYSAKCDYCGNLFNPKDSREYWEFTDTLADGTDVVRTGVYCSEPCGQEYSRSQAGTARG